MNKKNKILFIDILTDDKKKREAINKKVYGGKTYSERMRRAFGVGKNEWAFLDVTLGIMPKNLESLSAIVLGGL